jgi:hypothetical protein
VQFYVEENYLANARSLLAAMRKEKGVKPDAIVANLTGEHTQAWVDAMVNIDPNRIHVISRHTPMPVPASTPPDPFRVPLPALQCG